MTPSLPPSLSPVPLHLHLTLIIGRFKIISSKCIQLNFLTFSLLIRYNWKIFVAFSSIEEIRVILCTYLDSVKFQMRVGGREGRGSVR